MALALAIILSLIATINRMDAAMAGPLVWERTNTKDRAAELMYSKTPPEQTASWSPLPADLTATLLDTCTTYDVPVPLALGVMEVESGFRADAVGVDGRDYGLFQLRDSNHEWLMEATGADPGTPAGNITCGVYMLSYLLDRYDTTDAALTAYRWGMDTGDRDYANKVLRAAEAWEAAIENPPAEAAERWGEEANDTRKTIRNPAAPQAMA